VPEARLQRCGGGLDGRGVTAFQHQAHAAWPAKGEAGCRGARGSLGRQESERRRGGPAAGHGRCGGCVRGVAQRASPGYARHPASRFSPGLGKSLGTGCEDWSASPCSTIGLPRRSPRDD
jgi:hypothetical protein